MPNYPLNTQVKPVVEAFFDDVSNTISYVVKDPESNACAVVDSVLDIDYAAGQISYDHADEMIGYIQKEKLQLEWIIETHVHADHLSAALVIVAITVLEEIFESRYPNQVPVYLRPRYGNSTEARITRFIALAYGCVQSYWKLPSYILQANALLGRTQSIQKNQSTC